MFSIADMAVAGAVALLLFGPDQLPKVARRAGQLVRDVQNTSQSFIREMERAADDHERRADVIAPPAAPTSLTSAPSYHETPEPAPHELVAMEAALEPHPAAAGPGPVSIGPEHTALETARPRPASPATLQDRGLAADSEPRGASDGRSTPGEPAP